MKPLTKNKYYVKCGTIEQWVMAYDPINAAVLAYESYPGGQELDQHFHVCVDYVPEIEQTEGPIVADVGMKTVHVNGVHFIPVSDVIKLVDETYGFEGDDYEGSEDMC